MKTKLILQLIVIAFPLFVNAQTGDGTIKKTYNKAGGYSFNFGFGATQLNSGNLEALNTHLQKYNYALAPIQYSTWNLDVVHALYKNTVFNFGLTGLMKRNTVSDSSKTTMSGFAVNVDLGRVIYHANKLLIYPMVGARFGSSDFHSHYTGFNKASDISGTNSYRAIDFSFNIDYLTNGIGEKVDWSSSTPNLHPSGVLSLSVGYTFCPFNTYWNDNNYDISSRFNSNINYPANVIGSVTPSNFSMFYVTLKFGMGLFSKQ
ncbi:MAG TPA: hypothetical protein VNZ49_12405 [Bacteroidia bacterium]|jgi:hypothetical protein|nr:hypothetical protein [Bacteroidia bacterium]